MHVTLYGSFLSVVYTARSVDLLPELWHAAETMCVNGRHGYGKTKLEPYRNFDKSEGSGTRHAALFVIKHYCLARRKSTMRTRDNGDLTRLLVVISIGWKRTVE